MKKPGRKPYLTTHREWSLSLVLWAQLLLSFCVSSDLVILFYFIFISHSFFFFLFPFSFELLRCCNKLSMVYIKKYIRVFYLSFFFLLLNFFSFTGYAGNWNLTYLSLIPLLMFKIWCDSGRITFSYRI